MPSIYDEMEESRIEREFDETLSDREADELLERLEAEYARFRKEIFAKWSVDKQAAFERRGLLYSCLQARNTIARFTGEMIEVEEGVDIGLITEHFRMEVKSTQSALARLRIWRTSGITAASMQ